jgi:hypothetical protein
MMRFRWSAGVDRAPTLICVNIRGAIYLAVALLFALAKLIEALGDLLN